MKCLVDANVLSEPTKPRPNRRVLEWLSENDANVVVNPIILGELQFGALNLPAGRRRTQLLEWFAAGVKIIPVLEIDAATGEEWANLLAELRRMGRAMPVKDSLIAASARQHSLTVATRNEFDYRFAGVTIVNPFD